MEEGNNIRHFSNFLTDIYPTVRFDSDVVDIPPKDYHVSKLDIILLASSIIMHIVDMLFDYNIAIRYILGGKITYFAWTICLILIPSLINVIISRRMQRQDKQINSSTDALDDYKTTHLMINSRLYFMIAVIFQLAPIIHYYETLKYALKVRKCEKSEDRTGGRRYYIKMLKEDQDVALLRIFECFLEAAPQQTLQLTLMLKHYHNEVNFEFVHQAASIVSSFASMGWAMASYHNSIRLAQQDKSNISIAGTVSQFLWHICITVARILSLSVFASVWPVYVIVGCAIHWIMMTMWIVIDSHGILEFCRNYSRPPHAPLTFKERICSILFAMVIGVVHVFIYLKAIDRNTFWKHIGFYVLCFSENLMLVLSWRCTVPSEIKNAWYFEVLFGISIGSFIVGIAAMILYYTVFHPSKRQYASNTALQAT